MEIGSSDLWDRLALLLNNETSQLVERPQGPKHFENGVTPFTAERFKGHQGSKDADRIVEEAVVSLQGFAQRVASGDRSWEEPAGKGQAIAVFVATFEFQSDRKEVRTMDIYYTAKDGFDAICGAIKFWIVRQVNIPDHFHRLFALNIRSQTFGRIGGDGTLYGGTGLPFFEWKIDAHGMPLEIYAMHTIEEIARKLSFPDPDGA
jgi:hypothetical protein